MLWNVELKQNLPVLFLQISVISHLTVCGSAPVENFGSKKNTGTDPKTIGTGFTCIELKST
jgi:hypothetical protein